MTSAAARSLQSDESCAAVEPLLPSEQPERKGGCPRVPDRARVTGILFVFHSGT